MTQLTSITNLRNSNAQQGRVDTVFRYLKGLNPNWNPDWFFPIGIIRVSNDSDDCTWVRNHSGTHHKGDGNLTISGHTVKAADVIERLKGVQANDAERLTNFNVAINLVRGGGVDMDWKDGMIAVTEAAVGQSPFVPMNAAPAKAAGTSTPAVAKKTAAKKSSTVKPIATKGGVAKATKLDAVKKLFNDLTPKQKVEFAAYAEQKILASKPCLEERTKLVTAPAA